MPRLLEPPLAPRKGRQLKVLAICRISGDSQDAKALIDQEALYRRWLADHTDLPFDMDVLAGRGSGECLDRNEHLLAIDKVESRQYDLIITEDLGRICRRMHAHLFCESCEDSATRLVAINDHVDTAKDDWRLNSFFAVMRHEAYNKDTSNRIRRTHRNRFSQGGVFQCYIFGYVKPPGAKSEADVRKDPDAEEIYREWFRRLENGATYAEIADWLNEQRIPTGRFCRTIIWTCAMVARVTHNPILKGLRVRNDKMSRRINKTGRRRSVKAPVQERLERQCPHLAFFDAAYYDRVIRIVDRRNAKYRRKGIDGIDTRRNVAKKRTAWPGQHVKCGICGRMLYWTGVSSAKHMMCSGAHTYQCWNSITLNGVFAAGRLSEAILGAIQDLPEYDDTLLARVRKEVHAATSARAAQKNKRSRRLQELDQQIARVTTAVADMGSSRALQDKLKALEAERDEVEDEINAEKLEDAAGESISLPSIEDIKRAAGELFSKVLMSDPEASRLVQYLISDLRVLPYRLCTGGAVVLRAHVTLNVAALASPSAALAGLNGVLRRGLVVDLFKPPQHVHHREQVVALRAQMTEREAANRLNMTVTAAQRAVALTRRMRELDITDPYLAVLEPPLDYGKLRRHRHPRYHFEPLNQNL